MYQCNLCKRSFSRQQDLTQHYNQLHSNIKHSNTLSWVQSQQQLNSNITSQEKIQTLNNNIWNEIKDLNVFSQITSIDRKQNNEIFVKTINS